MASRNWGLLSDIGCVFGNVLGLMSGAVSVPFALLAAFDVASQRALFASVAYVALFVLLIAQARKLRRMNDELVPRLKLEFDSHNPQCSVMTHFNSGQQSRYLRILVTSLGPTPIEGCSGAITKITRNGVEIMSNEIFQLTFALATDPDSTSKTLREKMPYFLDVLVLFSDGTVLPAVKNFLFANSVTVNKLFRESAKYMLWIVVSSTNSRTLEARLEFNWTGDWKTATCQLQ